MSAPFSAQELPGGGASLRVEDLRVRYPSRQDWVEALGGVRFEAAPGDRVAVVGPSGCGKTTLLYSLAGLVQEEGSRARLEGRVLVNGQPVRPGRLRTALVLQDHGLLPWKTAEQNVALPLLIRGMSPRASRAAAARRLEELGLGPLRHLYPAQLSGGQRQRVALARALVLEPDLLLMDEPFSALDAITREALQDMVADLAEGRRFTLVLVTHDIAEAAYLACRVVVLSARPGRVVAVEKSPGAGRPEYRRSPQFFQVTRRLRQHLDLVCQGQGHPDRRAASAGPEARVGAGTARGAGSP